MKGPLMESTLDAELYKVSAIMDMQYSIDIENYKLILKSGYRTPFTIIILFQQKTVGKL